MTARLADTPLLETERLTLRAPGMQDWDAWCDFIIRDDRSKFVRAGEMDEPKAWRALCHITGMWALRGYGSFVFTMKGEARALGMTGPWHPWEWPEREIGWTIWSTEAEGKGLAFEAATAARAFAFETLGWDSAVSYIHPENIRSISLANRLGATLEPGARFPGEGPALVYRHPRPEARA
jgi:RimJ/RimL family protein N-acetyltransferase